MATRSNGRGLLIMHRREAATDKSYSGKASVSRLSRPSVDKVTMISRSCDENVILDGYPLLVKTLRLLLVPSPEVFKLEVGVSVRQWRLSRYSEWP